MGFLEFVVMRLFALGCPPSWVGRLADWPGKVKGWLKPAWSWLWDKRLDPDQILTEVVRQQENPIEALKKALARIGNRRSGYHPQHQQELAEHP